MRERDLSALKFGQVRQRLSELAQSPGGRQACLRLTPSPSLEVASTALDLAWQLFRLTEKHGDVALGDFPDVRAALHQAAHPGFVLDGPTLVGVLTVLDAARRARAYLASAFIPRKSCGRPGRVGSTPGATSPTRRATSSARCGRPCGACGRDSPVVSRRCWSVPKSPTS